MAVLNETISFPLWVAAALAVAIIIATVLVRRLGANRQMAIVAGVALLALVAAVGPALLRVIADWPDRHQVVAAAEPEAERRALERRRAELGTHVTARGSMLACLSALASEPVEAACEHSVFASPTSTAVAVAYAAAQLRLLADGVAFARRGDPSYVASLADLRLAVENDAYGIYAYVLAMRDGCTPERCDAFALVRDPSTLKLHLRQRAYATTIAHHRERWAARAAPPADAPATVAPDTAAPSVTTALAPPSPPAAAMARMPIPRARPTVTAAREVRPRPPATATPVPPAGAAVSATAAAPSLWLSSAAIPVATAQPVIAARADLSEVVVSPDTGATPSTETTPPAGAAAASREEPPAAASETSRAAAPAAADKPAAAPVAVDSPTVTAYARQARARGVVPPAASVLRHLEYPSASSIPPISIMAAEPELPAEAAPSTAPIPRSRPR